MTVEEREKQRKILTQILNEESGKWIMDYLEDYCGFRREVKNEIDEGKRRVYLNLLRLKERKPDEVQYLQDRPEI